MFEQTNLQKDSSMLNWFPRIKDVLPVPRTEILNITDEDVFELIGLLDGENISGDLFQRISSTASKIGYPLFMRSDQGSAKHSYEHSCHLADEKALLGHLSSLIEWHLMVDLWPRALAFRELLNLYSPFKAFEGLPIAKERRYFIDGGKVVCHHPYWPEGAIEKGRGASNLPVGWKERLAGINVESTWEISHLSKLAEKFNERVPGFYSVDFAQDVSGNWFTIDAARGELSWHPEHND